MTICLCHGGICELSIRCSWPLLPYRHPPTQGDIPTPPPQVLTDSGGWGRSRISCSRPPWHKSAPLSTNKVLVLTSVDTMSYTMRSFSLPMRKLSALLLRASFAVVWHYPGLDPGSSHALPCPGTPCLGACLRGWLCSASYASCWPANRHTIGGTPWGSPSMCPIPALTRDPSWPLRCLQRSPFSYQLPKLVRRPIQHQSSLHAAHSILHPILHPLPLAVLP